MTPNQPRSLPQWLDYIHTLHPNKIQLGIDRAAIVAKRVGLISGNIDDDTWDSHMPSRVVTVTGTNGKGSTVALLSTLLMHAGISVGHIHIPAFPSLQ